MEELMMNIQSDIYLSKATNDNLNCSYKTHVTLCE